MIKFKFRLISIQLARRACDLRPPTRLRILVSGHRHLLLNRRLKQGASCHERAAGLLFTTTF